MTAMPITHEAPTASALVLRALARWPERIAFSWDGGSMRRSAVLAMIGRFQTVVSDTSGAPTPRLALLSANRAEAWCAKVAVQALGGAVTWLHPMGALPDQLEQLADAQADALVVDPVAFRDRGGELGEGSPGLKNVWTLGPASFGRDLLAAADAIGESTSRLTARPDDLATLNYTGGTTTCRRSNCCSTAPRRCHRHGWWKASSVSARCSRSCRGRPSVIR